MSTHPDLVTIDTVSDEADEDFEGMMGFLIDTDIDWSGHGVYTVHVPSKNIDVRARTITTISKARTGGIERCPHGLDESASGICPACAAEAQEKRMEALRARS